MFGINWKNVGIGLAKVATTAASAALWASNHPEVISTVAMVAGHPEVAALVTGVVAEARATASKQ